MLSKQITELRKEFGLSQAELAKELNISASAEGMYEQGRRVPSLNILIAMSEIFDVSLDYLITGSEHVYSNTELKKKREECPCSTCYWKSHGQR